MRKSYFFHNQKRNFKFYTKNLQNTNDINLKKINESLNSVDFSFENFKKELIKHNEKYNFYFDPIYRKKYKIKYNFFLKSRIKSSDNIDLFALFLSKDIDSFSKFYRKINNKSVLLDDMLINLSIKSSNVNFILEINNQKENEYNFLGFKLYLPWIKKCFSIKTPEYLDNNINMYFLKNYDGIKNNPSIVFFKNIANNLDNEESKLILSKYNVKLNNDYNKMILENLIKNKNKELIKLYINSPFFSLIKKSPEQFKYLLMSNIFVYSLILLFIIISIYFIFKR